MLNHPRYVLLIDSDELNQERVALAVSRQWPEAELMRASSVEEALNILKEHRLFVVILDISRTPGGAELLLLIKKKWPHIYLIATFSPEHEGLGTRKRLMRLGADAAYAKHEFAGGLSRSKNGEETGRFLYKWLARIFG